MTAYSTPVLKKSNTQIACLSNPLVLPLFPMNMSYGARLRAARKHKKWSQDMLAFKSGVGQGTISKIERGDQEVSTYDIELAHALDVHPMWLKNGSAAYAPDWLQASPDENHAGLAAHARSRIEVILDAADKAMKDSGLEFTDKEKLDLYIEAVEFAGSKQFSAKLISSYMLEILKTERKKTN